MHAAWISQCNVVVSIYARKRNRHTQNMSVRCSHLDLSFAASDLQAVINHGNAHAGFPYLRVGQCNVSVGGCCFKLSLNISLGSGSYAIPLAQAGQHGSVFGGDESGLRKGLWHLLRAIRVFRLTEVVEVRPAATARPVQCPIIRCVHRRFGPDSTSHIREGRQPNSESLHGAPFSTHRLSLITGPQFDSVPE